MRPRLSPRLRLSLSLSLRLSPSLTCEVWGSPFDMRLCVLSATCPLNFTFVVPRNATSALWYADNILSLTPNPNPSP